MTKRPTYDKLAIYLSRDLHFQLKIASIGEHRSLSDFTERLLRDAMVSRNEELRRGNEDQDDDETG